VVFRHRSVLLVDRQPHAKGSSELKELEMKKVLTSYTKRYSSSFSSRVIR
jgi:hypothetical protein